MIILLFFFQTLEFGSVKETSQGDVGTSQRDISFTYQSIRYYSSSNRS